MGFASMQRRTSMTLIIRTNTFAAMTRAAREAAGHRNIFIVAENEPQDVQMVKPWQKAASVWMRCGMTISTTPPWSR